VDHRTKVVDNTKIFLNSTKITCYVVYLLVRLILRPRNQILASLSDKSNKEESEEPLSSVENEASKSISESEVEEDDDEPGVLSYIK